MRIVNVAIPSVLVAIGGAVPFTVPLPNGFPNLNASALAAIEDQAGGSLTNMQLPSYLHQDAVTAFQIIALSQFFEVAFFTSLLHNITNEVPGYTDVPDKDFVIESLMAIQAQEQLHAVGGNNILKAAGHPSVSPCRYIFGVDNYIDAAAAANTFTDIIISSLQYVQMELAVDGGIEASFFVPSIGSILGQEGEQDGAYRVVQGKMPPAAPFLTTSTEEYVYNIINQLWTVPGSCPDAHTINVPIFEPLNILTPPSASNTSVLYSTSTTNITSSTNLIVYMTGQRYPLTVPIYNITSEGPTTQFTADFPFEAGFSKGLTVAILVNGTETLKTSDAVVNATLAGPGLIEVE